MEFDLTARPGPANYDLITQTVVPRPIAWVLTANADGSLNLAPFSYFSPVAAKPALLSLSIGLRPDGTVKDTRRNLAEGRPAVVHVASFAQIDAVNGSAASLPPGESEVAALGLETVPFGDFPLPRLACAPVAYGCRLFREVTFPGVSNALVVVEALCAHVDDALLAVPAGEPPRIVPEKLAPLARLGRTDYAALQPAVSRPRPF